MGRGRRSEKDYCVVLLVDKRYLNEESTLDIINRKWDQNDIK